MIAEPWWLGLVYVALGIVIGVMLVLTYRGGQR